MIFIQKFKDDMLFLRGFETEDFRLKIQIIFENLRFLKNSGRGKPLCLPFWWAFHAHPA